MISVAKQRERNSVRQLIAFAGVSFLMLFNVFTVWSMRELILTGKNDFRPYYAAALMIRRGDGAKIYRDEAQREMQREILPDSEPAQLPFNHPAYEALLFVPLTYLPYKIASLVWTSLNVLLLLVVGTLLFRWYKDYSVYLVLLSFAPIAFTLILGQDSILLLLIFVLALREASRGRDAKAGVLLALGLFRFHLVLPFIFILTVRRQLRLLAAFLATALALIGVSIALAPNATDYLSLIMAQTHQSDPRFVNVHLLSNMPTIHGLLYFLVGSFSSNRIIGIAGIICSLFLLLWIALKRESRILSVPAAVLASHYMYAYDLTLLAPTLCEYVLKDPSNTRMVLIILMSALPVYLFLGTFSGVSLMALPLIVLLLLPVKQTGGKSLS